jgi:hypothetical protein
METVLCVHKYKKINIYHFLYCSKFAMPNIQSPLTGDIHLLIGPKYLHFEEKNEYFLYPSFFKIVVNEENKN